MDEKIEINLDSGKKPEKKPSKKNWILLLIGGIVCFLGGVVLILLGIFLPKEGPAELIFPSLSSKKPEQENVVYSKLTGQALSDPNKVDAPAYCIQVPNGTDGARPQSGINEAGVIFEAIAEAGITRFAAIFQDPSPAVIGPIRSLRLYYLEWDTPFNCTIVHAGGAYDALQALKAGGYRDLTENYTYMYRGTYRNRLWNNLFTTSNYLNQFGNDRGYTGSDISGFSRMTPSESNKNRVDSLVQEKLVITKPTENNTSKISAKVSSAKFRFGNLNSFNVNYSYDIDSNKYLRNYDNGLDHNVYDCPKENLGETNPEDACSLTQLSPSVVIAIIVKEKKASDNYHEDITTIGSGDAYIFQNGILIKGTWNKSSRESQIKFFDENDNEVLLAPGQTMISAVPTYGAVEY